MEGHHASEHRGPRPCVWISPCRSWVPTAGFTKGTSRSVCVIQRPPWARPVSLLGQAEGRGWRPAATRPLSGPPAPSPWPPPSPRHLSPGVGRRSTPSLLSESSPRPRKRPSVVYSQGNKSTVSSGGRPRSLARPAGGRAAPAGQRDAAPGPGQGAVRPAEGTCAPPAPSGSRSRRFPGGGGGLSVTLSISLDRRWTGSGMDPDGDAPRSRAAFPQEPGGGSVCRPLGRVPPFRLRGPAGQCGPTGFLAGWSPNFPVARVRRGHTESRGDKGGWRSRRCWGRGGRRMPEALEREPWAGPVKPRCICPEPAAPPPPRGAVRARGGSTQRSSDGTRGDEGTWHTDACDSPRRRRTSPQLAGPERITRASCLEEAGTGRHLRVRVVGS